VGIASKFPVFLCIVYAHKNVRSRLARSNMIILVSERCHDVSNDKGVNATAARLLQVRGYTYQSRHAASFSPATRDYRLYVSPAV